MGIDEAEGVRVLKESFAAAGLTIVEGYALEVAGTTIELDGFDPDRKIGFEYLTTAAGDREEITPAVLAELEARMGAGELYVLLIDESEVDSVVVLERAATLFLDALRARGFLGETQ